MIRSYGTRAAALITGLALAGCGGSSPGGADGAGVARQEIVQKNDDLMRSVAKSPPKHAPSRTPRSR